MTATRKSAAMAIWLTIAASEAAIATDLRGQVQIRNSSHPAFTAAGITLKLYKGKPGQWDLIKTTSTEPDGMYYLRNVPAAADYALQVGGANFKLKVLMTVLSRTYLRS